MAKDKKAELNRRKFMEIGIYVISGTITAVSCGALARFAVGPSFNEEKSKWIAVDPDILDESGGDFVQVVLEFDTKDGWVTSREKMLAYIRQTKQNEIIAISATCTHLGCNVLWKEDKKIFKCPCHNGRYDVDGKVISGPPPAPLQRHKTKLEDGKLYLATKTEPYRGDTNV